MAADAPVHCEGCNLASKIHMGYVTMACLACESGEYMTFMSKPDEFWEIMHPNPGNGFLGLQVSQDLVDFWTIWQNKLMTARASGYRWDACHGATSRVRVTELAVQGEVGDMLTVTKGNRLRGRVSLRYQWESFLYARS